MPNDTNETITDQDVHCYAIRRVNPFLGVLQIIETSAGRAVSANGVVWDIEVRAERPGVWGSLNKNNSDVAFYRYGLWSQEDGLVSRPLAPHLEKDPLTHQCNYLIKCICEQLENLPFTLEDTHELWLYDRDDQYPIAILATTTPYNSRPSPEPKYWSSTIGVNGVPSQYRFPEATEIETQVKRCAGFNVNKYWIVRQPEGGGYNEAKKTQMFANEFPPFLIRQDWLDKEQHDRALAYINWIAPSLLTLQNLTHADRERLERKLHVQAVSIEHHWKLYPEIINEKLLKAALVQCRLVKANQ